MSAYANVEQLPSPEEALRQINAQRSRKLAMAIGGLVLFIVAMVGATALMYTDWEAGTEPVPARMSF